MEFQPDYHYMLDVLANRKPARLPVYEHIISIPIMEQVLNLKFGDLMYGSEADLTEFFRHYNRFWQKMTYDTISFEVCITEILPDNGAIYGAKPGPVQTWADFERYPWDDLPDLYWQKAHPRFKALARSLPPGMKALGGVGNGVFEISEDLVGFNYLAYMSVDNPDLFAAVHVKIGDLMVKIWEEFLRHYADLYAVPRFGDDLGFKTSTLTSPAIIRNTILPQYKRVIDIIKGAGKPFLWHSCGNIFKIMPDVIALGINAKHSNEDVIAPFERWIEKYGDQIGLLGGIDVDLLCQKTPAEITQVAAEKGRLFRSMAKGYALGSGNSIPEYVPVDGYLAMVAAANRIRE